MKRLSIVAALVAIGVAVPLSIGSSHREAPLTSIDPTADDTDVYAYHGEGRSRRAHGRRELGSVRGPGRRPELLQVRSEGAVLHQRRQHRRRQVRRPLPLHVPGLPGGGEQGLVPVRVPRRDVDRRRQAVPEADLRRGAALVRHTRRALRPRRRGRSTRARASRASTSRSAASARSASCAACGPIARNVPVAPNNVGPKTIPNYTRSPTGDHRAAGRRQGVRGSA